MPASCGSVCHPAGRRLRDGGGEIAVVAGREVAAALRQVIAHLDAERERAEAPGEVLPRRPGGRRLAAHVTAAKADGSRTRRLQPRQKLSLARLAGLAEEE